MLCYHKVMIRIQIQLTEEQRRKLRRAARDQGVSLAEMVRRLIDRGMEQEAPDRRAAYARAAESLGKFRDREGAVDVGTRHDDYLDDVYE